MAHTPTHTPAPPPPPPPPPAGGLLDEGPGPLGPFVRSPTLYGGRFGEPGSFSQRVYAEGDEWSQFVGLAPERTSVLQRSLVDAGLLQGEFRWGRWDAETAGAMAQAMAYGNAWGVDYTTAITRLASAPSSEDGSGGQLPPRNQYLQPAYQRPTPELLAQEVKGFVRDRLGREPDDVDMATLTEALQRFHRRDYERQVALERSEFGRSEDARLAEAEAALAGDPEAAGVGAPGEFLATGPDAVAAAFAEFFDDEYANELDRRERVEEVAKNESDLMTVILSADRAIGAL